jgi:predicted transcriptional regulator of viral defense system
VKILKLNTIEKNFFGFRDISNALGISHASARVVAHRYTKNGVLVRIKPDIFVLTEKWNNFTIEEKFQTANLLQVPSYVSLTTALEYYEITTQIQQNYIECVSIRRTFSKKINELTIRYSKVSEKLYFGFERKNNVYIAQPEKALIDAMYLASLGRYSLDIAAVSLNRFDQKVLPQMLEAYPLRTKNILRSYGFISPT